ncbi:hypothetical protein RJ641_013236 [Dillenia turbinata]|uniref:Polymerase/histidinol phosphatase N-terminal domain-containing protein n=1 Tax=Dillenia turbinata TaxID=194707 RepID=A0AAN8ZQA4_9MAGN
MNDGLFHSGKNKGAQNKKKKNKKKKGGGSKKKLSGEQLMALKSIKEWVFLEHHSSSSSSSSNIDDFGSPFINHSPKSADKILFELHSHSKCSDGLLSPSALVEVAHQKGESELAEPVHILAYYSSCGPTRSEELDKLLAKIRDGRYLRAKNMVSKLNSLKLPLKLEHVAKIAGKGVAPGRNHVARAMVEAGYVENMKQAFSRYLYDNGPAYAMGSEPLAEEAVKLVRDTGGFAVLAHPWALKNPVPIIRKLKEAGLHGMEVYRSNGIQEVYGRLADAYDLVKLGGSDYHGITGKGESDLASVNLPVLAIQNFLKVARPIWCSAISDILKSYTDEPSDSNLEKIKRFAMFQVLKGDSSFCSKDLVNLCMSSWLTIEERQKVEFEALK